MGTSTRAKAVRQGMDTALGTHCRKSHETPEWLRPWSPFVSQMSVRGLVDFEVFSGWICRAERGGIPIGCVPAAVGDGLRSGLEKQPI